MNYSLGNMLSRGGALNPDGLALDLQFAADKTLTARRGPTPVFTRLSGATQVNAAGLIEYAPENLILYSNNVANAAWTKEGGTIASSAETINGLAAEVFNENSANSTHRFFRLHDGFAGVTSTFSMWLKAAGRRYVSVNLGANGPNTNSKLVLDLVDRVVIAGTTGVTTSILLENNGWARYSFTFVPRVDSSTMPIQSNFSSTVVSETGVGLNGAAFYVAGQQYERASTAGPYMLTTTTAAYSPRFDHDPVTLSCKGLLIEESRTNSVLNSDLYLTSTPTNITATTIAGTSVTGSSQIRELSLTSSGLFTGVQANLTGTGTGIKTLSVFIKKPPANAAPYFTIGFASSAIQYAGIQVTMTGSTPVVSVTSAPATGFSVVSSSIETFSNDWYRVSVVVNGVPASCFATLYPSNAVWNGISDIRQTLVAAGTNLIYVFGAQVELGSFPTSYIPTTTAAVVRSADICSITGGDFTGFWNQSAGTLVESFEASPNTNTTYASASNGNIVQNSLHLDNDTGLMRAVYYSGSSLVATLNLGAIGTVGVVNTIATAYSVNDFAASRNGATVVVDTSGAVPASLTQINIGTDERSQTPTSFFSNRCIKSLRYYKKRLPNAKLQTLSA